LNIANLYSLEMQYFLPELNGRSVRDSVIRLAHRAAQRANGRFSEAALQRRGEPREIAIGCLFYMQCPQTAHRVSFSSIQHGLQWAPSCLAASQQVELRPSPESRHFKNRDDPAFSPAWPGAPTFGLRKPSFAKFGLTDGSEPIASLAAPSSNWRNARYADIAHDGAGRLRPFPGSRSAASQLHRTGRRRTVQRDRPGDRRHCGQYGRSSLYRWHFAKRSSSGQPNCLVATPTKMALV